MVTPDIKERRIEKGVPNQRMRKNHNSRPEESYWTRANGERRTVVHTHQYRNLSVCWPSIGPLPPLRWTLLDGFPLPLSDDTNVEPNSAKQQTVTANAVLKAAMMVGWNTGWTVRRRDVDLLTSNNGTDSRAQRGIATPAR